MNNNHVEKVAPYTSPRPETSGRKNPATNFSLLDKMKRSPRAADYNHPKRAKVLLIEDDRTTRRLVSAALREHCDLIEAADVNQGFSLYNTFTPDIVFMDIELPESDGHGLLSLMLWDDPDAFVIMFSGHSDNNNVIKSIEGGAKGFVSKPFDINKMLYFIEKSTARH